MLACGVWHSTAGASGRMVGAGRGGGRCATAGRIFSARFESSRVLNGFVLLFCCFVRVFVAGDAAWQPLQAVRIVWPLPAGVLCAFALASCALCLWFLLAVGDGCVWTLGVRTLLLLINLWLVQWVQRVQLDAAIFSRELCFCVRACEYACFCWQQLAAGSCPRLGGRKAGRLAGWQAGRVARYGCRCRVRCAVAARVAGVWCAGRVRLGRVGFVRRSVLALAIAVVIPVPGAALACCRPRPPCGCTAVSPGNPEGPLGA